MSSDDHTTKVPHKPGPLRIIQGKKVESAGKRPTAFQQLRTITIPPILSWMAHRVSTGHGPWTSEFDVEKVRLETPQQEVSLGRRLRWAGMGALVAIVAGLMFEMFLNRKPALPSEAMMASPVIVHSTDMPPHPVSSTEAQSANVTSGSSITAIDSNSHSITSAPKSNEHLKIEFLPPKTPVSSRPRTSQSTREPLDDAERTF